MSHWIASVRNISQLLLLQTLFSPISFRQCRRSGMSAEAARAGQQARLHEDRSHSTEMCPRKVMRGAVPTQTLQDPPAAKHAAALSLRVVRIKRGRMFLRGRSVEPVTSVAWRVSVAPRETSQDRRLLIPRFGRGEAAPLIQHEISRHRKVLGERGDAPSGGTSRNDSRPHLGHVRACPHPLGSALLRVPHLSPF